MSDHSWVQIGRELMEQSASLRKTERVALIRERAKELGLSHHTVGRFFLLAGFLTRLGLSPDQEKRLPIGVIEVVYRLDSKDQSVADAMLKELIEHGMTFREALRREMDLTRARSDVPEDLEQIQQSEIAKKIWTALRQGSIEDYIYVTSGSNGWRVAIVSSSWLLDGMPIAFITEGDKIYLSKRGFKNFIRDVIAARFEYEWVVVEFTSQDMFKSYQDYMLNVPEIYKKDIKTYIRFYDSE